MTWQSVFTKLTPMPWWWWLWLRWNLGVGEFKVYGPRNQSVRPEGLPAKIPLYIWAATKLFIRARKPATRAYNGILTLNGAWLRNPRGGVEGVAEAFAFGIRWLGPNLNKGDWLMPASWDTIRTRAWVYGMGLVPWKRCRNAADILDVLNTAALWQSGQCAINLEDEAKDTLTPEMVAALIKSHGYTGEVVIFAVAWLYNSVDWKPLADYAFVLQIFPRDAEAANRPTICVAHAHELGIKNVFMAFDGRDAAPIPLPASWSVYTMDDAAGRWFPRG